MPDPEHPDIETVELTTVLAALADPVRLEIVRLAGAETEGAGLPCNAFAETIPKSTMAHHWKVLREAGLIRQTRRGTQKLNTLRRADVDRRFPGLLEAVLRGGEG